MPPKLRRAVHTPMEHTVAHTAIPTAAPIPEKPLTLIAPSPHTAHPPHLVLPMPPVRKAPQVQSEARTLP